MDTSAPKNNGYRKAVLALIIANIIWGAASPIFKWSLQNIPPFSLAFLRFYYASLILAVIIIFRSIRYRILAHRFGLKKQNGTQSLLQPYLSPVSEIKRIFKFDFKNLLLLSLCGITFNITFFFLGLNLSSSIDAPVIASAGPMFIFFLAIIFLGEKFKIKRFLGMIISLIGVVIIVIQPMLEKNSDATILGNLFFILATLGAVGQAIIGKKIYANHNFILVTLLSFIIGGLTFLPLAYFELIKQPVWIANLDYRGIFGILFGSVLSSAVAYTLFGYGLSKIPTSNVAIFSYLDPIIAVLVAIPLLGEKITNFYIIGTIFILTGIFVAEKRLQYHPLYKLPTLV